MVKNNKHTNISSNELLTDIKFAMLLIYSRRVGQQNTQANTNK